MWPGPNRSFSAVPFALKCFHLQLSGVQQTVVMDHFHDFQLTELEIESQERQYIFPGKRKGDIIRDD